MNKYLFKDYYEMWRKHGIKIQKGFKITDEILKEADQQNEICDLIWIINEANQENKSIENLSETVMEQISQLSLTPTPILLSHIVFNKYPDDSDKPKKIIHRARRHFNGEHKKNLVSFKDRQPKIKAYIYDYINMTE